jgi:hypothetical protein
MNPSLSEAQQLYMEQGIYRLSERFIKPLKCWMRNVLWHCNSSLLLAVNVISLPSSFRISYFCLAAPKVSQVFLHILVTLLFTAADWTCWSYFLLFFPLALWSEWTNRTAFEDSEHNQPMFADFSVVVSIAPFHLLPSVVISFCCCVCVYR